MLKNELTKMNPTQLAALAGALDKHACVAVTDAKGLITFVNDEFCALSQYSRDELMGQNHRMIKSGVHETEFFRSMWRRIAQGGVWQGELCNRTKDGSLYWVATTIAPYLDESGKPQAYVALRTDITSIKQSQLALGKQRARLEEAQQLGQVGHWELDLVNNKLDWSSQVFRIFEINQDHFAPSYEAFLSLIHPDDRERVKHSYSDAVMQHREYQVEHRLLFADGRVKWVVERGNTHYAADGTALYSIGTVQDVSERKEVEKTLRIASVAFETQEAIVITDAQANIISVNKAFERTTGYTAAEVMGKNPKLLKSGRHDADFYRVMWSALENEGQWAGDIWDRRKDGSLYPKWQNITAVKDESGELTHYVSIWMDISDRKRAEAEIERLAFYDPLTELPNRRLFLDRLQQAVRSCQRSGTHGALFFMDIDNFKQLNDTQGHAVGDKLLIEVAARLKSCVRETDSVARLGGDEFVVILSEIGNSPIEAAKTAETVAQKILSAMRNPFNLDEHACHYSMSIGICLCKDAGTDTDELLKRADTAMYQAKAAGGDAAHFFEASMQEAVKSRALLEGHLRTALDKRELCLYYQQQLDNELNINGAEVLLRWFSADLGSISPVQFIPLAEETGLILPIGNYVLETACTQLKKWQRAAHGSLKLAVNVSARQFRQKQFVNQVETIISCFAIDPALLKLELTESVVLDDVEDTISKMRDLKKIGVLFSMDDFGTGYSSLSYLKRLPFDQIKIDQSFVRDLVLDKSDRVLVKTIIEMARNFDVEVIAEGVETNDQLIILQDMGCNAYQGYLFGKPVAVDEFERLVG